jgi:hypothetical protein
VNVLPDLSKFQANGHETCFHDRHIGAQIVAGLNGSNWRLLLALSLFTQNAQHHGDQLLTVSLG